MEQAGSAMEIENEYKDDEFRYSKGVPTYIPGIGYDIGPMDANVLQDIAYTGAKARSRLNPDNGWRAEQVGHQAIVDSLNDIEASPENIDRAKKLQEVVSVFVDEVLREGTLRRHRAEKLVAQLDSKVKRVEKPNSIICIPLAVHEESPGNVAKTLEVLSLQEGIDQSEIVIYANCPSGKEVKRDAISNSIKLKTILEQYPNLQIKFIYRVYPVEELQGLHSMAAIRADYMDAIVLDSTNRGLDQNTPVIWLDADITKLSRGAIKTLEDEVKKGEVPFIHPALGFGVELPVKKSHLDPTDLTDLTAIDEIIRRKSSRTRFSEGDSEGVLPEYTEECGLSFSIGSYCLSTGVTQSLMMGYRPRGFESTALEESATLMFNFRAILARSCNQDLISTLYPGINTEGKITKRVPAAKLYTSARRSKNEIKTLSNSGSVGNPRGGYSSQSFAQEPYRRSSDSNESAPLEAEFAKRMIERSIEDNNPYSDPELAEDYARSIQKKVGRITDHKYNPRVST